MSAALAIPRQSHQPTGTIKGTLLAPGGAVIPKGHLVIEGGSFKTELTVDQRGNFQTSLPAGAYRLTTLKVRGFAIYKRKLRVKPGQTVSLDIVPKLVLSEADCVLQVTGHP
jgi:Carboxypeptidase regulatory-like domain